MGNWVGSILLLKTSGSTFFLIMGLAILATSFAFLGLMEPEPCQENLNESTEKDEEEQSFWETTLETLRFTVSREMWLVNPVLGMSGVSIAYFTSLLVPVMVL